MSSLARLGLLGQGAAGVGVGRVFTGECNVYNQAQPRHLSHPPPQEKGSSQMHQEGREEEGQPEIQAGANTHAHTVMPRFPLSRAAERVVS